MLTTVAGAGRDGEAEPAPGERVAAGSGPGDGPGRALQPTERWQVLWESQVVGEVDVLAWEPLVRGKGCILR